MVLPPPAHSSAIPCQRKGLDNMRPWLRAVPWYLYPALPWVLAVAWVDYWRDGLRLRCSATVGCAGIEPRRMR